MKNNLPDNKINEDSKKIAIANVNARHSEKHYKISREAIGKSAFIFICCFRVIIDPIILLFTVYCNMIIFGSISGASQNNIIFKMLAINISEGVIYKIIYVLILNYTVYKFSIKPLQFIWGTAVGDLTIDNIFTKSIKLVKKN